MFPYVQSQDGSSFYFRHIHQGIVLVGGGNDFEFAAIGNEPSPAAANLSQEALVRYINLKAWRAEVAKEHNLPAYVIFHDATLALIASADPQSLNDLNGISGIGAKKLEAYGQEVLQVCRVQLK